MCVGVGVGVGMSVGEYLQDCTLQFSTGRVNVGYIDSYSGNNYCCNRVGTYGARSCAINTCTSHLRVNNFLYNGLSVTRLAWLMLL